MSKYDQLDYLTRAEKSGTIPDCVTNSVGKEIKIPEELIGLTIENFKNYLNIKTVEDENRFLFVNNNQTIINENYFENGKFFNNKMENDEKREFLLDFLNHHYGNRIDGKYFQDYLQGVFNLKKYELIDEDFDLMIYEYFKKHEIDLNDPEDRKEFKKIMFHQEIKFLTDEEAQKAFAGNEDIDEESHSKGSEISN